MEDVTLAHAKEHLEELVARAARGEDVRIADPNLGTVRLTADAGAETVARPERRSGRWKGRLNIPDDELLEPMSEDELKLWYGEDS